ncbi:hypothetical protein DZ860_01185 [Vibrio sinensis]|uniref:Exo-alpha-sialidase n=1 Tax=Vibrio sinensis TaxID=2302434 RepID=A0A3A6QRE3_9VIBR|nr:exo-alpha-sialidase [Vibrio sinensis]RJX75325.1 hypothetical protein DZ860_01185 [Vibrio sinensis]
MNKQYMPIMLSVAVVTGCGGESEAISANSLSSGVFSFTGDFIEQETVMASLTIEDQDGIDQMELGYRWYDDMGVISVTEQLVLEPKDVGKNIHLEVTFTDDMGNEETLTSQTYTVEPKHELALFYSASNYKISQVKSTDFGQSWSSEFKIDQDETDPDAAGYYPNVASDGKGNIVAVWTSEYVDAYGGEYDPVFSYSNDNGLTFSDKALLNPSDVADSEGDEDPTIATDKNGNWVAVWSSGENIDGSGTDGDIVFVRSQDNGKTWTEAQVLHSFSLSDRAHDWYPTVKIVDDRWIVVWMTQHDFSGSGGTDRDIVISYSQDQGATWSDPKYVNSWAQSDTNSDDDSFPLIDLNSNGSMVVAWSGHNGEADYDIYAAMSSDFGETWSTATKINDYGNRDASSDHDYPRHVAINENNTAVISWHGKNAAFGGGEDLFYSSSFDYGNSWSSEEIINVNPDTTTQEYAAIISGPDDRWIACWVNGDGSVATKRSTDLVTWSQAQYISQIDSAYYTCNLLYH